MTATLAPLLELVARDPALAAAVAAVGTERSYDLVGPEGLRPMVTAVLAAKAPVLAVVATGREADELVEALGGVLDSASVALFPSWETLPHERLSPRADTVGRRMAVLRRLAHPEEGAADGQPPLRVVVSPVRSVLQPTLRGLGEIAPVRLAVGERADLEEITDRLAALAYTRVDLVERRGEFAVRGGLLDVFPPTEEHPLRLEFFGDDVEDIRAFAVADQRTLDAAETDPASAGAGAHRLTAPPCRELLITADVRARALALISEHPELTDILDKIAAGISVDGMEALAPVLAAPHPDGPLGSLLDLIPAGAHVLVLDPERVRTRAAELVRTGAEFLAASWSTAALGGQQPVDLAAAAYRELAEVRDHATACGIPWWSMAPFGDGAQLTARPAPQFHGDAEAATVVLRQAVHAGDRIVVTSPGHGSAQRIAEMLAAQEVPARTVGALPGPPDRAVVTSTTACLSHGFVTDGLLVLTETDLLGVKQASSSTKLPGRRRNTIDPLALKSGDPVVHDTHGVGRYVEMVQRTVAGATREYLVLEYAPPRKNMPGDRVYVPTDSLDQLSRYVGGESPPLHRLGGADWQKAKGRARKAVREIAGELIRLYAARMSSPGYAFGPDTPWQTELEDAFPYRETADQAAAIDEVKADMRKPVPMDRVICGDVGFGKTEIAVRAAFKAIQDGKQVAVLCPTTLLARQHLQTFTERFAPFPVTVAGISRFNTDTEQKRVLTGLADGSIDLVIGTHRLLSASTRFKDIGLIVVDEEQRFGVEHKEHLKAVRATVDVLSMSATPIPRTLEMSLTGIREMSVIATPPEERHPVLTFVGPYEDRQVSAAIRRELLREGQVFYLHNRVESIDRAAARIRELVPEARVAVAHGQMHEDLLEQVMVGFWEKDYDVLVSTTIVEAGLDIPNANTMVVERADAFGLSQLHQLRGRVGRGRDRAYAYFLYPAEKPLTETAYDRLATIAQNTDLGAGMAVAMKDLEIRGAGNLLGGEQSGHIAGVGFDLYVRMVGEAVRDFRAGRGEDAEPEPTEVKVELPVNAHLPHDYVPSERLRLEAYRRLAEAATDEAVAAVRDELRDRYGPPPEPVENLLAVAAFRVIARSYGLRDIGVAGNQIRFAPLELRESQGLRLARLYKGAVVKAASRQVLVPRPTDTGRVGGTPLRDTALLAWAAELLEAVAGDSVAAAASHAQRAADG
jgi:transcription-repair coupling factor (superfamily II helicase)